jgi:tetratricopeptide (TPR) repeat protein
LYYPDYRSSATLAISERRFGDALTESQRLGAWAGRFPEAADVSRGLERDIQHVWARALLEQGDKRGALEHARAAARIQVMERQLDHVHYQLGGLFYQLGDPADALAQLRLYLRKQPNGPLAAQARDLQSKIEQPSPTTVSEPKN